MKRKSLFNGLMLAFITCLLFSANNYGETMGASSLEWLTVSSEVVATGKILKIEKAKGLGEVVYENYLLEVIENIKGAKDKKTIEFTIRTFSTEPVFEKTINISDEVMIFLSPNKEKKALLEGKLVPTSNSFPLSIINLNKPGRYLIDINFNVLNQKVEIVETCRQAQKKLVNYKKQNPGSEIKSYSADIPMGAKAFSELYAGSSCFLIIPDFLRRSLPRLKQ